MSPCSSCTERHRERQRQALSRVHRLRLGVTASGRVARLDSAEAQAGWQALVTEAEAEAEALRQAEAECSHQGGSVFTTRKGDSLGGYREAEALPLPQTGRNGSLTDTAAATAHRQRQAVLAVARLRETVRRQAVRQALAALDRLLQPQAEAMPRTWQALEAHYQALRQARREAQWLMSRQPFDGRPPVVGSAPGVTVNGSDVRQSPRWQSTPRAAQPEHWQAECRRLTISTSRRQRRGTGAAVAAALGGGRQWQAFEPAVKRQARSRRQAQPAGSRLSPQALWQAVQPE